MHEEWKGEGGADCFIEYLQQPDGIGLRPHRGFTLHRIDNGMGYSPGNLKWETKKVQAEVRSSAHMLDVEGQRMNLSALASILGKKPSELGRQVSRLMKSGHTQEGAVELIMAKNVKTRVIPRDFSLLA